MSALSPSDLISISTGVGGIATAAVMGFRVRSQNRADNHGADSVDRAALSQAIETVQQVYSKLTGDLREQVDDLIERDKNCREELDALKQTVAALTNELAVVRAHLGQAGAGTP